MRCGGLPEVANPAYLVRFLCSALHRIALPMVSEWWQEQVDGASPIPLHVSLEGHSLRNGLQNHFVMVRARLRVSLLPFWRPRRARRPGRCHSCVGLGSFGAPGPSSIALSGGAASLPGASPIDLCSLSALCGG